MRQCLVDQADGAHQCQLNRLLPGLWRHALECPRWRTSGVDDQNVQAAELLDGGPHKVFAVTLLGHVLGRPAHRSDGAARGLDRVGISRCDVDPRTLCDQCLGAGSAEAFAGGGDESLAIRQAEIHCQIVDNSPPSCGTQLFPISWGSTRRSRAMGLLEVRTYPVVFTYQSVTY